MEHLVEDYNKLRLLLRNVHAEISASIRYRKEYVTFLSNLSTQYPFEYSLATTHRKRLPVYFEDAVRLENGTVVSETHECLLVVRNFIAALNNYAYTLYEYILDLIRIYKSLVYGMGQFRDTYMYCILENDGLQVLRTM
jgi:hypothetical protein